MKDIIEKGVENFKKGFFSSKAEMKYFSVTELSDGDTIRCNEDNCTYIYFSGNPYNVFTGKWKKYDPEKFLDSPIDGNSYLRKNAAWEKGSAGGDSEFYTKEECDNKFITKTVNNLVNYYLKSETYSKSEVTDLINKITTINFKVVDELPESGESNLIYLVKKEGRGDDVHDEYIWVEGKWKKIGSTTVDLTNYYTKTDADGKFALKTSIADMLTKTEASSTYATKTQLSNKSDKIVKVDGGTGEVTQELQPNKYYSFGECTTLNITLAQEISGIYNEYIFKFVSGGTPTALNMPEGVNWSGSSSIEASKTYIVKVCENIAVLIGA